MNEIYNHKLSYRIYKMEIISNKLCLRQHFWRCHRLPYGQKKEDGTTCSVRSSALLTNTIKITTASLTAFSW